MKLDLISEGLQCHKNGSIDKAEAIYKKILARNPKSPDALHLLGVICYQKGDFDRAQDLISRAIEVKPNQFAYHSNLGNALLEQNHDKLALENYEKAISLNPEYGEAHYNKGNALAKLGHYVAAIESYDKAISIKSDSAIVWLNCGNAFLKLNKPEDAVERYDKALSIHPDYAEAYNCKGLAKKFLQQYDEAVVCFKKALEIKPDFVDALLNCGNALIEANQCEAAMECIDRAIAIKPNSEVAHFNKGIVFFKFKDWTSALRLWDKAIQINSEYPEAYFNKGNAYFELDDCAMAIAMFESAIKFKPDYAEAYYNLGNALIGLDKIEQAIVMWDNALAHKPDYAEAYYNRGCAFYKLKQISNAIQDFDKALLIDSDYAVALWNKSIALLLSGNFKLGLPLYEWRWKLQEQIKPHRKYDVPIWRGGEQVMGKTVLIHAEQGLGDTIQFCRYAALLSKMGAKVLLEVPKPLMFLMSSLDGVDGLLEMGEEVPPIDFHVPMMSMPLAFRTVENSIPSKERYLRVAPDKIHEWRNRLGPQTMPRIALVWSGSATHKNDRSRSLPLRDLLAHLPEGLEYISLQKEVRQSDEDALSQSKIRRFEEKISDFSDTAALVELVDLVICVDTSVAHLSAALGKETWILLPYVPDWRWALNGSRSSWYPSARLFRQNKKDEWGEVLDEVSTQLKERSLFLSKKIKFNAIDEIERRKSVIQNKETDLTRWSDKKNLEVAWERRSLLAADFIPSGSAVLDVGCGMMLLERHLPFGCQYMPMDVVQRDDRTIICDLNKKSFPSAEISDANIITMLGVFEYLYDIESIFKQLFALGKTLVCSYCGDERSVNVDRKALGWVNNLNTSEFLEIAKINGYFVKRQREVDPLQCLFKLEPQKPDSVYPQSKRVHILSYNNVGNFGDRLGFHLVSDILPSNAEVSWGTLRPFQSIPNDIDLLIVGIGNSLFGELIDDELISAIKSSKASLGIFGTQYREKLPSKEICKLLDAIGHWYARYEEDVFLYGNGRTNVTHLGDWLINAFPMAKGSLDKLLQIGPEVLNNLPLDRVIQQIQQYKFVHSTRLHPLLCAITSSEIVSYSEQCEYNDKDIKSGKFRSMLIDIFGMTFPENTRWQVDRNAVADYKLKVKNNTEMLKIHIGRILES